MAILTDCSLDQMVQASKCFDQLSSTEKLALQRYFLAQALKSFDGPDWTNNAALNQQVACLACSEPKFRLESMLTSIFQKMASAAGASVDLPIDQLRAKVNCAGCGNQALNRAAIVYLQCALALISR